VDERLEYWVRPDPPRSPLLDRSRVSADVVSLTQMWLLFCLCFVALAWAQGVDVRVRKSGPDPVIAGRILRGGGRRLPVVPCSLSITNVDIATNVTAGSTVSSTMTITVGNAGPGSSSSTVVTGTFSTEFTVVTLDPGLCSMTAGTTSFSARLVERLTTAAPTPSLCLTQRQSPLTWSPARRPTACVSPASARPRLCAIIASSPYTTLRQWPFP
jgi:hypothetical protein